MNQSQLTFRQNYSQRIRSYLQIQKYDGSQIKQQLRRVLNILTNKSFFCRFNSQNIIELTMNIFNQKAKHISQNLKQKFVRLSFFKKIIIIFTINTLLLLIITDAVMLTLFHKVSNDIIEVTNTEKDKYNLVATTQIAGSVAKLLLSKFDLYANNINLLIKTFFYFPAHRQYYKSNQNSSMPRLTEAFLTPSYNQPGIYFATSSAINYHFSFCDQLLSKMLTDSSEIMRINVYSQNLASNYNDITINTIPGTNDFIFANSSIFKKKSSLLQDYYYSISESYSDVLSKSNNTRQLISLTVGGGNSAFVVMIEIQMRAEIIQQALSNIYYLASTYIMLVKDNGTHKVLMSKNSQPIFYQHLDKFYEIGTHQSIIDGQKYVSTTIGMTDRYKYGVSSTLTNSPNDPFRCIVIVKASQAYQSAISVQDYLATQENILRNIILFWSFVILTTTVALATVMGKHVFFNLHQLSFAIKKYIATPNNVNSIILQIKSLRVSGALQALTEYVIKIIEMIQLRKRERKDRIDKNYCPLNLADSKFQQRQQLNDYQILESVKKEIKSKVDHSQRQIIRENS